MKILVINAGSSSLKYQLIDMKAKRFSQRATASALESAEAFSDTRQRTDAKRSFRWK